jgi:hypothetical protein
MNIDDMLASGEPQMFARSFLLANGNQLHIRRCYPSGLWKISFERGRTPDDIAGKYQTFQMAKAAVDNHIAVKKTKPNPIVEEIPLTIEDAVNAALNWNRS